MSGFRIRVLYSYLSVDGNDGDEGVCTMINPATGLVMRLIAANEERRAQLKPVAQMLAKASGQLVRLVRFEARVPIEEIHP